MSQFLASPITMIAVSPMKDTGPTTLWAVAANRGANRRIVRPATNGTPITRPTSTSISEGCRSMDSRSLLPVGLSPPQNAMLIGISTIASRLETAVIETDSATSPPARWVRMLDTFPGGQQATRIMPSATEPRTSRSSVSRKVIAGSSRNWAATPIAIVPGRLAARLKSSRSVSRAIPNRIRPMTILSVVSDDSLKTILMSSTSVARAVSKGVTAAPRAARSRGVRRPGRRPC